MTNELAITPISPMQQRLASRLQCAREDRGWSQRQLGVRMGLPPKTGSARVNRYEHGRSALSMAALEKVAQTLGLPCAYFFLDDEKLAQRWLSQSPAPDAREVA